MALLSLENISLSFAGVKAIDGVSLGVDSGELLAVIGPNGAGKTSLFNCISGVYKPQQGRVLFDSEDLTPLAPHAIARRGIARTFQNLALFAQLTVQENLLLGRHHLYTSAWWQDLLWLGRSRREEIAHRRKVEDVIDFLGLASVRKMPVGVLPYGVLKRIELGRALCMEPRVLLLDEPAAGLNQEETEDLARYLLDIKEELHVTQILIEHEMRFVFELADRVAVLDFGRKIAEGSADEVRLHPAVIEAYIGGTASTGGSDAQASSEAQA